MSDHSPILRRARQTCILAALVSVCYAQVETAPQPLTVCEVLDALKDYNGRLITVRGLDTGAEGRFLAANCERPLVTEDFAWPSFIELHYPDRLAKRLEFDAAYKSGQAINDAYRKMGVRKTDKLFTTITGILYTDSDLGRRVISRSGVRYGSGFGAGNFAPASLEVRSESDPEIERCITIRPSN